MRTNHSNFKHQVLNKDEGVIIKNRNYIGNIIQFEKYEILCRYENPHPFESFYDNPKIYNEIRKSIVFQIKYLSLSELTEFLEYHFENCLKSKFEFLTELKNIIIPDREIKEKKKFIIQWIKIKKLTIKNPIIIKGFQSNLKPQQIESLYEKMNDNYFKTSLDNFNAIFKDEPLPNNFKVVWIDKGKTRHEPNKQTIFEFFYLLKEFKYLEGSGLDTNPGNNNNLYRKLETIFPDLKNFGNSNPFKVQRNTPRQKELEKIILSVNS